VRIAQQLLGIVNHFTADAISLRRELKLFKGYSRLGTQECRAQKVKARCAPPWECDVTKWIKGGENKVKVTVIGTLKNTLGPHHGNPVLGADWPKRFQTGPNPGPPAGTNYSTVAYGCFQPFVLKQTTSSTGNWKESVAAN